MTSCLYPGLFQTCCTCTHTASIDPRQPRLCSWERNWPRSTPGYFGKLLRTCVSCKYFSPSAPLTQKRSCAVMGAPGEEQRGLCQAPREEEGAQEHWHLLTVTSRKQGSGGKEESDMD